MDDDDLFVVFNEKRSPAKLVATSLEEPGAPGETEFEGFYIDSNPLPSGTEDSSAEVEGWSQFQPICRVPVNVLRRSTAAKLTKKDARRELLDQGGDIPAQVATDLPHAQKEGNACFNCGDCGHNVASCPKPRDHDAIILRRKQWESQRRARPSWMDEPRYFVSPGQSKVSHIKPGQMTDELRLALGITHLEPPPYLANMIQEGYPPGFVDVEGRDLHRGDALEANGGEEDEDDQTLRFICGGEEMDLSPEGELRKAAATSLPERERRAIMTVSFPGAFGAPPPPNVDVRLWRYDERETNQEEGGGMQVDSKRYFQPSLRPHPPQPPPTALFQQHERHAAHACVMGSMQQDPYSGAAYPGSLSHTSATRVHASYGYGSTADCSSFEFTSTAEGTGYGDAGFGSSRFCFRSSGASNAQLQLLNVHYQAGPACNQPAQKQSLWWQTQHSQQLPHMLQPAGQEDSLSRVHHAWQGQWRQAQHAMPSPHFQSAPHSWHQPPPQDLRPNAHQPNVPPPHFQSAPYFLQQSLRQDLRPNAYQPNMPPPHFQSAPYSSHLYRTHSASQPRPLPPASAPGLPRHSCPNSYQFLDYSWPK